MGQGFIDTRKDGIQAQKEWLEEQTKQKEEGETGLGLGDAYGLIGSFQASLENDKERLERDALSIVMGDGEKISSYQDSAQRERLEELQAQYQALEEMCIRDSLSTCPPAAAIPSFLRLLPTARRNFMSAPLPRGWPGS